MDHRTGFSQIPTSGTHSHYLPGQASPWYTPEAPMGGFVPGYPQPPQLNIPPFTATYPYPGTPTGAHIPHSYPIAPAAHPHGYPYPGPGAAHPQYHAPRVEWRPPVSGGTESLLTPPVAIHAAAARVFGPPFLPRAAGSSHENSSGFPPGYGESTRSIASAYVSSAGINARDGEGRTALFNAVNFKNENEVRRLLSLRADATIADNNGFTPLHFAAIQGDVPLVRALIGSVEEGRRNAYVNAQDRNGRTALHHAAAGTVSYGICHILIEAGINVSATMSTGQSALSIIFSRKVGEWEAVRQLITTANPSTLPYAEELKMRVLLAHLTRYTEKSQLALDSRIANSFPHPAVLCDLCGSYDGGYANWRILADGFEAFTREYPGGISPPIATVFLETLRMAAVGRNQSPEELFRRWQSGLPVILNAGHDSHYASVLVWRDRLVRIDTLKGFLFNKFDTSKMSVAVFKNISTLFSKSKEEYFAYFRDQISIICQPKSVLEKYLEEQFSANGLNAHCSWDNSENMMQPFFILADVFSQLQQASLNFGELKNILKKYQSMYHLWQGFFRTIILKEYLSRLNKGCSYIPDFNLLRWAIDVTRNLAGGNETVIAENDRLRLQYDELLTRFQN